MGNVIATNVASLNAQRNLLGTNTGLQTTFQRLSSGFRINSAKDDAAGLQISNKLGSQIGGLTVASRNANDGISLAQVAEGALAETTNILQRMRDLSIQSASGTNGASERAALQQEVSQLQAEMNRIADTTRFGSSLLLNGTFGSKSFQVGANAFETINVSLANVRTDAVGSYRVSTAELAGTQALGGTITNANTTGAGNLVLSGFLGSSTVAVLAGASAGAISASVNSVSAETGVSATARTVARISSFVANTGTSDTVSFKLNGSNATAETISAKVDETDLSELSNAVNKATAQTGVRAELSADKQSIDLVSETGDDVVLTDVTTVDTASTFQFTARDFNGGIYDVDADATADSTPLTVTGNGTDDATAVGVVRFDSSRSFTVSGMTAVFGATNDLAGAALKDINSVDISTSIGAQQAITIIDKAIESIDSIRGDLGAVQNRFQSTISNLDNVKENVAAARSRIRDTDFAQETANLSKFQVLSQAGLAILSQANASSQNVLSLLRGG